jgi:sporulation protein YlmC with PRC-barrel domain
MMHKLLMATAVSLVATGGAFAAGEADTTTAQPMTELYLQGPGEGELATTIIGQTVYTSDAQDEAVGDINDLIVGDDGTIEAVVIGVGGFLGVGEKNVAVSYDSLHWTDEGDGDRFAVFEASREDLQNAPEFTPEEMAMAPEEPMDENDQTAMAPEEPMDESDQTAMAPEEPVDESDQTAMAPTDESDSAMLDVRAGSVSADELLGATVYAVDDNNVGEVGDVRLTSDGEVDAVIVDVGGFLGMGEKPVAIAFESLAFKKDDGGTLYVYTDFTRDQLDAAPAYDEAAYDDQRDAMRLTRS